MADDYVFINAEVTELWRQYRRPYDRTEFAKWLDANHPNANLVPSKEHSTGWRRVEDPLDPRIPKGCCGFRLAPDHPTLVCRLEPNGAWSKVTELR